MKSKSTLLTTLLVAAAATLGIPTGLRAQTNEPPAQTNSVFFFRGGTPDDFLFAVEKQYHVDWRSVADIPREMQAIHIPRLRMTPESLGRILDRPGRFRGFRGGGGGGGGGFRGPFGGGGGFGGAQEEAGPLDPLEGLLALYNSLQQARPELGTLTVEGDLKKPSVVLFSSPRMASPGANFKMRAFPARGIPPAELNTLIDDVEQAIGQLAKLNPDVAGARISLHPATGMLVVVGPEPVMELMESIVTAWHANHERTPSVPPK